MRKIILYIASSLDGFIASDDGSVEWLFHDQDYGYGEFYDSVDTLIMGRLTYEQVLGFGEYPWAGKTTYVLSRKKRKQDEHAEFLSLGIIDFMRELKLKTGRNIWLVGGGQVNTLFLQNRLIDEIILSVHPVILGHGLPLFANLELKRDLKLNKSQVFDSGLVQLHYLTSDRG